MGKSSSLSSIGLMGNGNIAIFPSEYSHNRTVYIKIKEQAVQSWKEKLIKIRPILMKKKHNEYISKRYKIKSQDTTVFI